MFKAFVFLTLLSASLAAFPYQRQLPINDDALQATFSDNLKHIALLFPENLIVVNTDSAQLDWTLEIAGNATHMAVGTLNTSVQLIAVGEDRGRITVYNFQTGEQLAPSTADKQSQITSLQFSDDGEMLFVSYKNSTIRAFDWQTQDFDISYTLPEQSKTELRLSTHPSLSQKFVVSWATAGQNSTANVPVLSFFQLKLNQSKIELIDELSLNQTLAAELSVINSLVYNPGSQEDELLFVGDSSNIFSFDPTLQEVEIYQQLEGSGNLLLLLKSQGDNAALLNGTHVILISSTPDMLTLIIQQFPTESKLLAINRVGGQAFYIPEGSGNVAVFQEQCDNGQFYTQDGCLNCKQAGCAKCVDGEQCGLCSISHYPSEDLCLPCIDKCQLCFNSASCTKCLQPFTFSNSQCSCGPGKYYFGGACLNCSSNCLSCNAADKCQSCKRGYGVASNGLCSKQLSFSIFAIIVGGAGLVMLGIIVASLALAKEKKQSLLSTPNEED